MAMVSGWIESGALCKTSILPNFSHYYLSQGFSFYLIKQNFATKSFSSLFLWLGLNRPNSIRCFSQISLVKKHFKKWGTGKNLSKTDKCFSYDQLQDSCWHLVAARDASPCWGRRMARPVMSLGEEPSAPLCSTDWRFSKLMSLRPKSQHSSCIARLEYLSSNFSLFNLFF